MGRYRFPAPSPLLARRSSGRRRPAPDLKRRRFRREPKRRFILFCEGKNTEPAYFDAVKRACVSALIDVEVVPAVGVPYTIAESAGERARSDGLARNSRRQMNSFEENDQVWAVFDRDQHPRFNDAVALCEQAGVHVAQLSGPALRPVGRQEELRAVGGGAGVVPRRRHSGAGGAVRSLSGRLLMNRRHGEP